MPTAEETLDEIKAAWEKWADDSELTNDQEELSDLCDQYGGTEIQQILTNYFGTPPKRPRFRPSL